MGQYFESTQNSNTLEGENEYCEKKQTGEDYFNIFLQTNYSPIID